LVWTLLQLNIPISYSIGTTLKFGPSGKFNPKSEYFIYECDEYDRNFLHYNPYLSLITSIDYDHSDTYQTEADYQNAFQQFAMNSNQVITWNDQHSELFKDMPNVTILNSDQTNSKLAIVGKHNRRNATMVQFAMKQLGLTSDSNEILEHFPGTGRRFEKLADGIYSDYGHHPVEIAATLQLAHEMSDHVVLVYQPHQNIRQHEICKQYTTQFELAETIYWLPTYLTREDPKLSILSPKELIKNITNKGSITIADLDNNLLDNIKKLHDEGKLILFMGAGTIDSWLRENLIKLI